MARHECSSHRSHHSAPLSLLSQPSLYSTTVSQALGQTLRGEVPKGYLPAPATHEDIVVAPRTWKWGTQVSSSASVLMVNVVLTPPQRPLRASLTVSVSILMVAYW